MPTPPPHRYRFKHGSRIKFETPNELVDSAEIYFRGCERSKEIPSFAGFCVSAGCTQSTMKKYWDRGDDYKEAPFKYAGSADQQQTLGNGSTSHKAVKGKPARKASRT